MIILDTNVLSELMRAAPSAHVFGWVARWPRSSLFTTTVTLAEILYGLELLPKGRRRTDLTEAAIAMFGESFPGRILPFDGEAAAIYPRISVARRKAGRPISQFDALIASIALSRGATLATRNTADFDRSGVEVVNPWTDK